MKKTVIALLAAAVCAAASAGVLAKRQAAFLKNRRIAVKRDTTTIPGAVITTWYRDGKPDTKGPAVVTNCLRQIVGAEQRNPLQELAEQWRIQATNATVLAEARAARLEAFRNHLVEQRDKAVLATTKAIYQALIDRIDGKER